MFNCERYYMLHSRPAVSIVSSLLFLSLTPLFVALSQSPPPLPFFGLKADSVQPLLPGTISTGLGERDGCFSADGKEFYYSVWTGTYGAIVSTRLESSGWTKPEVVSFSGRYSDLEAFIAPDGLRMYFASNRPDSGDGPPGDFDIWYVDRVGIGWGAPHNIGAPVNTEKDEFYPSVTARGDLYVTGEYAGTLGGEDIWRFERRGDSFGPAVNLGPGVNSAKGEFNAFADPGERFLLFSSFGRPDQIGGGDLYISERQADGSWGTARILGPEVNSKSLDYCPWVSPDGSFMLFSSRRPAQGSYWSSRKTLDDIRRNRGLMGNGMEDVYVISAKAALQLINTNR